MARLVAGNSTTTSSNNSRCSSNKHKTSCLLVSSLAKLNLIFIPGVQRSKMHSMSCFIITERFSMSRRLSSLVHLKIRSSKPNGSCPGSSYHNFRVLRSENYCQLLKPRFSSDGLGFFRRAKRNTSAGSRRITTQRVFVIL